MSNRNRFVAKAEEDRIDRAAWLVAEASGESLSSIASAVGEYLEWARIMNYSDKTIAGRAFYLNRFRAWAQERGVKQPHEVNQALLEAYQAHLFIYRTRRGEPLSARSQYLHVHALRMFFRWALRHGRTSHDPADELTLPRLEHRLPRDVFTHAEAEAVLRQPNLLDPLGLRDRAILEVLYSTGIRRTELTKLTMWDLDRSAGTLLVRMGKGRRDRVVPIGNRAVAWVIRYQNLVRPLLARRAAEPVMFLTKRGDPLPPSQLSATVTAYINAAGTGKHGSCHLFRHTCATLMLEGGADIRFIQELLGHASLASTQIYTRVSIRKLKEVHTATHPTAGAVPQLPILLQVELGDHVRAGAGGPHLEPGWKRPYLVAVGHHLRHLRELRGLSRDALGVRVGSNRGHIRKLEEGIHPPRPAMVAKLARALAIDPADLVPA